jgi:hypothetical protein
MGSSSRKTFRADQIDKLHPVFSSQLHRSSTQSGRQPVQAESCICAHLVVTITSGIPGNEQCPEHGLLLSGSRTTSQAPLPVEKCSNEKARIGVIPDRLSTSLADLVFRRVRGCCDGWMSEINTKFDVTWY